MAEAASEFGMAILDDQAGVEFFGFTDAGLPRHALTARLDPPPDWMLTQPVPMTWSNGQVTTELAISYAAGPLTFTITQCNMSDQDVEVDIPAMEFTSGDPLVWWLGGVTNYIARCDEHGYLHAFWPFGGSWHEIPLSDGVRVEAAQQIRLAPGQQHMTLWRHEWFSSVADFEARLMPTWYPAQTVVEAEDEITFQHLDGVIHAPQVRILVDYPNQLLSARTGCYPVTVIQAEGASILQLGWAVPLSELVTAALMNPLPADLRAWLLAWQAHHGGTDLDELDVAIAEALPSPTPFAVAAAADAATFLGRSLLSEAAAALGHIIEQLPPLPDGAFLAGVRLYAQALAAESAASDEVAATLWSPYSRPTMESELLTDPDAAPRHLPQLAIALGNGLPGHIPAHCARETALLKVALMGTLSPEDLRRYAKLHLDTERWLRATNPTPEELAWLLW